MLSLSVRSPDPGVAVRAALVLAAVSLATSAFACSSPPAPSTTTRATTYRASQPASTPAFEYLPRNTSFVIAASGPGALAAKLHWDQLGTRHRELYERAVAEVTQLIGHNLLDPDNLSEVGLDPQEAFGLAVVAEQTVVVFAGIIDHDRLQTSVYRAASSLQTTLVPRVAGSSLIIAPRGASRWQLIIRGQTVLLVLSQASSVQAENTTLEIAEIDIASSLAAHPDFAAAMADLRFGRDLAGYARLDQEFQSALALLSLQGATSLVFGAEIDERALRAKAFVPLAGDALVVRALQNSDKPSALLAATREPPVIALSAQVAPDAMAGMPIVASFDDRVRALGVEFMRDLAPAISGEVGFSLRSSRKLALSDSDPWSAVGVDATAELRDPDKMSKILARLLNPAITSGQARRDPTGAYIVSLPGWKELHIGVQGRRFYASSDPEFSSWLSQVAQFPDQTRPASPDTTTSAAAADLRQLFAASPTALRTSFDLGSLAFLTMGQTYNDDPEQLALLVTPPPSSQDRNAHVPISGPYKAREAELQSVRIQVYQAEAEQLRAHAQKRLDRIHALGSTATRIQVESGGLAVYGGQFFGDGGLAGALDALIAMMADQEIPGAAETPRTAELRQREQALLAELAAMRQRDIVAYERANPGTIPGTADSVPDVEGPLEAGSIQRVMKHWVPKLRACYKTELAQQPDSRVEIITTFLINGEGQTIQSSASGGPDRMNQCIVTVLEGMRFPRPRDGGLVEVTYPLRFTPWR